MGRRMKTLSFGDASILNLEGRNVAERLITLGDVEAADRIITASRRVVDGVDVMLPIITEAIDECASAPGQKAVRAYAKMVKDTFFEKKS
jgi:hypothetical protein